MAEAVGESTPSLAEQYLLKDKEEKLDVVQKPVDSKEPENPVTATATAAVEAVSEAAEATSAAVTPSAEESSETTTNVAPEEKAEDVPAAAEESSESAAAVEETAEATKEESPSEEAPELKLETAPADFRFPTTNQTRHCFTRYIEYHRCIAAKGDGAPECDKFAKYYRSLCPGEWVDKWNEQRENGTFPGPL